MDTILKRYQNIFAVLSEVKEYVGVESIGFSNEFMQSLDFMIDSCLKEMEAFHIYEEDKTAKKD